MEVGGSFFPPPSRGEARRPVVIGDESGGRKVTLRVLGPNTRARELYRRCGFVEEGVLRAEFVIDGVAVDDVLMARHLAPPVG